MFKSTEDDQNKLQSIGIKTNNINSDGLHLHFLKARNAWFEKALEDAKTTESKFLLLFLVHLLKIKRINILKLKG